VSRILAARTLLRAFILQRVKNWDLRELRERIADGYSLRRFTEFYSEPVPSHHAFHRAFLRLQPSTVRELNDAVVEAAVKLGIEDGKKLRVDTTVVETDIHYPTDGGLLWDSVRVITRLVKRLGKELPELIGGFADRTRRARRRMQEINRMDRQQRQRQQKRKYRDLLRVTEQVVGKARVVLGAAKKLSLVDPLQEARVKALAEEIFHYCGLAERVMEQTRRRVLKEEQVPAEDKLVSIFEPQTAIIKRGKVEKPVEFGRKVLLAESGKGLVTDYQVLDGNPTDDGLVGWTLEEHKKNFGFVPRLFSGDRVFYSQQNVERCEQAGVRVVCLPYRGRAKPAERETYERTAEFKKGQRFRAGIEGRISVLFRGRGMKRCLLEGEQRLEVFIGVAVLANNLMVLARHLTRKRVARRRVRA
jgi:IS5 family transposase